MRSPARRKPRGPTTPGLTCDIPHTIERLRNRWSYRVTEVRRGGSMAETTGRQCGKCGERPAGEGGVLCPECLQLIADQIATIWQDQS